MGSYFVPRSNYFFQDVNALGNVTANIFIGNGAFLTGIGLPAVANIDIFGNVTGVYANMVNVNADDIFVTGQIEALGNVVAPLFIGNGSLLTGITASSTLPDIVIRDINGNIIGSYANVSNIIAVQGNVGNTRFRGGNVAVSGQVNALGNVVAPFFIGNGSQLTGITDSALPGVITADILGNVIGAYANVTTVLGTTGNIGNVRMDTGVVTAPRHTIDSSYYLTMSGTNPIINLDSFDYLTYARTNNLLSLVVGGNTKATIDGEGNLLLTGNVNAVDGNFTGNIRSIIGNVGNTRFLGGNVAVSGQVNALGNVVAPFFVGNGSQLTGIAASALPGVITADISGNIIGVYANVANVIAVQGNVGNTRFLGGNVAVSGQVNALGNVVAPFFIGNGSQLTGIAAALPGVIAEDIRGNIIGAYANVDTVLSNITTVTCSIDSNAFTVNVPISTGYFSTMIYGTTARGAVGTYSLMRLDNSVGRVLDLDGTGALTVTTQQSVSNGLTLNCSSSGYASAVIQANVNRGAVAGYSFLRFDNTFGRVLDVTGTGAIIATTPVNDNVLTINSTIGSYSNTLVYLSSVRGLTNAYSFLRCDASNGGVRVFEIDGTGAITSNCGADANVLDIRATLPAFASSVINMRTVKAEGTDFKFINCIAGNGATTPFTVNGRGDVTTTGNVIARDGIFTGNVIASENLVALKDIRGSNIATITCAANANILTVSGTTTDTNTRSVIQATILRGNTDSYSMLRLDNVGGRLLDITGNGSLSLTSAVATGDIMSISTRTGSMVGNVISVVIPRLSFTDYSFITCRNNNGILFNVDGRGMLLAQCAVNGNVIQAVSSSATNTNDMIRIQSAATGATTWNMISAKNSGGNVFRVNGSGGVFGVGAFSTSGADYAEMFEWEDGNKLDEDRRGITVVLGNSGMIHMATETDKPTDVIGVVSVNPSVVGDTKWNEWSGRYLRDKFGTKLSNTVYYISNVSNEAEIVRCGINDNPPDGYEKIISSEFIMNPKFNPAEKYISRGERPEWSPIGLVGKLRVLPDQIVNPGWKLLRTIKHVDGDTLEYLVK